MQKLTTQDNLNSSNRLSVNTTLSRTLSSLDTDEFYKILQDQYGACWGTLKFEDSLNDYSNTSPSFLYVDNNIDLSILRRFMNDEWNLSSTRMVIPVLSGVTNKKLFKNVKIIDAFKIGITSVANASEVWFTTNGLDSGIPQIIGTAFRDETSTRASDDAWTIQMNRDPKPHNKLTLIGILSDNEIKDILNPKPAKELTNATSTKDLSNPNLSKDVNNPNSTTDKYKMEIKMPPRKRDQISLNSDHTHFIIIREQCIGSIAKSGLENEITMNDTNEKKTENPADLTENFINKFRDRFENALFQETSQQNNQSPSSPPATTTAASLILPSKNLGTWSDEGFPMVCILARGTLGTIKLVYDKIDQGVPTVVLKSTGSAADIIAFAYEEISIRNDKEYENSYLNVELSRRILSEYPELKTNNLKRNKIREQIISLVKKADQGKRKLLTFVDVNSPTPSLKDFRKFILTSLLQSQKSAGTRVNAQLKRNLTLTLDWNLPDLALIEIFQRNEDVKYTIPIEAFDKAVIKKDLEPFVDLLLDREFILHKYLKSDKLIELFNKTEDKDFFTTTSIEGICGESGDEDELPKDFLEKDLNNIVKRLTGISHFFSKHEMDCNAMGIYFGDKSDKGVQRQRIRAEKKALRHLIIYAILTNRHQLAKVLWKRSTESIPLALICSMMFKNLAPYCHETYRKLSIEKQAKEFSDCAVGVLEKAFNEDDTKTAEMLDEKHPDWNQMATVELAYNADNKEFVSHAACQKWVTRKFYGEITPRELSWGLFRCPDSLKITSSAILIFPMWFWISFSPIGQAPSSPKKSIDFPVDEKPNVKLDKNPDEGKQLDQHTGTDISFQQRNSFLNKITDVRERVLRKKKKTGPTNSDGKPMNFFEEIEVLWSAPITKFYTNSVAYIAFLSFFTLAVMWPTCGNLFLDCFVWFWAATIAFENTRVAYEKYCSQSSLPLQGAVIEVIAQTIFLALYLSVRIIGLWNFGTCRVLTAKAILGIGLIYYYYRILYIFFPISSKLGPMMIRLRWMIMGDFFTFLNIFVIFMISSGVAITAVLYPHYPLGLDLFSKAFVFRGLMALFSSEMADFKGRSQCSLNGTSHTENEYACLRLSQGLSFKYDNIHAYNRYGIPTPYCNQPSWIAWFLLIQYFFLAKRFLTSLLTAMFGITGQRVQKQSQEIWLYNRYEIVMEYEKRPRLPPPFVVISYIIMGIMYLIRPCIIKLKGYSDNKMKSPRPTRSNTFEGDENPNNNITSTTPFIPSTTDHTSISADRPDRSLVGRLLQCKPCQKVLKEEAKKNEIINPDWEDSEAKLYWKNKAKEHYTKTQQADKTQEKLDNLSNGVINIQQEINVQRRAVREINDRVVRLEKLMIDSHILLEKIRATIQQEDKKLPNSQTFIHMLSRETPYSHTCEARHPVATAYIPWTISFELYDPIAIVLPKEDKCFQDEERPFVEPNLIASPSDGKDKEKKASSSDGKDKEKPASPDQLSPPATTEPSTPAVIDTFTVPLSKYKWNAVEDLPLSDGKKMVIDRTTWIKNVGNTPFSDYKLDPQSLVPLNPMGRTGVRGRGALIRWGPNKSIMAVITRWKMHRGQHALIDGQRILEILVFKEKTSTEWILPGGKLLGIESSYGTVCRTFNKLAFQDDDSENSLVFREQDMIEHFQSFARSSENNDRPHAFKAHLIYRGYLDDERNTDNAWIEVEIWNFHYDIAVPFPNLRKDSRALWKAMTRDSQESIMQTPFLREIARLHGAYFE